MVSRVTALGFLRFTVAAGALLLAGTWLSARAQPLPTRPFPQPTPNDRREERVDFGSRESDARMRLILKDRKKNHEEHVGRAKEAVELAEQLQKTHAHARLFNAVDYKKLERLEKLTRRIRNEVGGSQTDGDPNDLPKSADEAVNLLVDMTKELCEEVENTPRGVVSKSIIDQANKLVVLIQFLRGPRD